MTGYWRSVALVFSGTAVAQMIPLAGSLVIARLFTPAEFGVFTVWLGLVSLAGIFVTGRFEMALALEPDGEPRATAAMVTALTSLMVAVALGAVALPLYLIMGERTSELPPALIALFVPSFVALAAAQIWQAWAAAEGLFRALSKMRITQAAAITGLQIAAGFLDPSATGLASGQILGTACGVAMMMRWLPPRDLPADRVGAMKRFWQRYRRFPIFSLPADTINMAAAQLPLLILAGRFGADVSGYVALAFRTLGAPISLLGTAVLDVFKRRASTAWRDRGECRHEYVQTFRVLAVCSVAASVVFYWSGEELFAIAFGEQWRPAGQLSILLLPLFALRFLASPLSYVIYVAEKQHYDLLWQVALLAMTAATLTYVPNYREALLSYALGYGLLYSVYLLMSYRFSAGRSA